jgi:hypothetical protein
MSKAAALSQAQRSKSSSGFARWLVVLRPGAAGCEADQGGLLLHPQAGEPCRRLHVRSVDPVLPKGLGQESGHHEASRPTFRTFGTPYRATQSGDGSKHGVGQSHEIENLSVEVAELWLEELDQTTAFEEPVPLQRGKDIEQPRRAGRFALAFFRI